MVRIEFNDLNVDSISEASGVFSGDNIQIRWKAVSIKNEGNGVLHGSNNNSCDNKSMVIELRSKSKDK